MGNKIVETEISKHKLLASSSSILKMNLILTFIKEKKK